MRPVEGDRRGQESEAQGSWRPSELEHATWLLRGLSADLGATGDGALGRPSEDPRRPRDVRPTQNGPEGWLEGERAAGGPAAGAGALRGVTSPGENLTSATELCA